MSCLKIKYVSYGLANNFEGHIELHKDLLFYKDLHDYILDHEKHHTSKLCSYKDLKNDLNINFKKVFKIFFFVLKRPSTWIDFIPLRIQRKHLLIDFNMIFLYIVLISILVISLIIYF